MVVHNACIHDNRIEQMKASCTSYWHCCDAVSNRSSAHMVL